MNSITFRLSVRGLALRSFSARIPPALTTFSVDQRNLSIEVDDLSAGLFHVMSVLLDTTVGEIVVDLEVKKAPKTCENFVLMGLESSMGMLWVIS